MSTIDVEEPRAVTRFPKRRNAGSTVGLLIEYGRRIKHSVKRKTFDILPRAALGAIVRLKMPRSAQLEVTTACNLRCALCPTHEVERSAKLLGIDHVKTVVESCGERLKIVNFHLLGEPLLHRGLFDFIALCTRAGVRTTFSTNGMLLHRHIDAILDSGLTHISIAIDGATAEDYSKYRIGGDLNTVIRNTRALIEARHRRGAAHPVVQVQMVMFSYNEDKEREAVEFLSSLGADHVSLKRPSYVGPSRESTKRFLEMVDHKNAARRFARPVSDPKKLYRNQRMCPQLERANVLSDGRVVACCMDAVGSTTFGNLNVTSFKRAWRGNAHREVLARFARGELEVCKNCTLGDA